MRGIILAAGRGSRMGGLTEHMPKGLVRLNDRCLLEYQCQALRLASVSHITVITGYKPESTSVYGDSCVHNDNWSTSNMVKSLCCATNILRRETCIVSYSDIVYHCVDACALTSNTSDICMMYDPNWLELWSARFDDPLSDAETFACTAQGWLMDIGRKPTDLNEVRGQYVGLLKFTPTGWGIIEECMASLSEETIRKLDMTSLLRLLLSKNVRIKCIPMSYPWGEVDTPSDLTLYEKWVSCGRLVF